MAELPEFLNETYESILERMLSKIPDNIDKSEGSFIYDALAPVAAEIAQWIIVLKSLLDKVFVQTTYGEYLDMKAQEFGLERKPAAKATGKVTFYGQAGTIIPQGTKVATESTGEAEGIVFITLNEAVIGQDGTVTVDIEAETAGTQGNVVAGAIKLLLDPVDGVTAVTNTQATTGGTDAEDDESLRQRILAKARNPVTSGNVNHYKQWALEVAGVGDVKVFQLWSGPGTVKVVIIDSNKQPASADLDNAVYQHIEENRPIGAQVTVVSAQPLTINVSATIVRDTNYTLEQVITNVRSKITEYLKSIAFKQSYVSYAQIGSLILDSEGVLDYSNLTINGGTANIVIGDEQVAVLGEVMLSE
ncbi:Baseplate J family protein [Caldicellulosiruptor hydrothermalis 108]|uniref:Baseplate J family protein n=1 Tax=Caldicellulosiruptor hydrothermalis (strain DSM 18901 / VKM B-2411 / 108) TaxID=632292 RepID=E4QE26_CALH1|nr:baseplate J/gp47 family protein [Caldicellulosiruptor hydrothermalis]ADQ06520.1 Baseplate J family protein [Caldicellulosiruptor hydrothermalis 108]